jgi:HlyD family secretion protein
VPVPGGSGGEFHHDGDAAVKKKTKIGIGIAGLLLVGTVGAGLSLNGADRNAVRARVEVVGTRDLVATVTASGWVRPRRSVDVQADIMGRITELAVKEGDRVTRGQLLLRIDPTQYEAAVIRARAAVSESQAREAQARAALLQAEQAIARARGLAARDSQLVSRQALEEAETQFKIQTALLEAARYGIEQARAAQREAEDRLSKTVIRAPIEGIVTRLNVEEGEMAIVGTMNNPGSLLLTISDLSIMEAVIRVDETDVPGIQIGDSARVRIDAFPRQVFTGRVSEIGHSSTTPRGNVSSQSQSVDFEVVITLDEPPATLRPDLSATADVITDTRTGALAIPIIALTVRERPAAEPLEDTETARQAAAALADDEEKDEEGVYLLQDGKARFVRVEVGIAGREFFEVRSGLAAGDSVIAGPYEVIRGLSDGKLVRRLEDKPAKGGGKATP